VGNPRKMSLGIRRNRSAVASVAAVGLGALAVWARLTRKRRRLRGLSGKVVCITGSSRGLGLALAEEFGRLGATLVLCARDGEELERARGLLVERGVDRDRILLVVADVRSIEDAQSLIQKATDAFGRVDVLVNNAGVIMVGPVQSQTAANFHDAMDTNFFGGVHCTLAVMPQMLERQDGSIINIASIGGKVAVPHLLPYSASKFAVVGFSQGLSAELRSSGVHVLTVCPGLMRTGSHVHALFTGDAPREYRWFSLLANLPGMSASARSAARRIVKALIDKRTELTITPQAALAARFAPLIPELTTRAAAWSQLLLPSPPAHAGKSALRPGSDVRERETWPAARIGGQAALQYNETD
jgi:NAD(P)-dependent dehydrogenase (short-subunit alcohol dehydrogenase family)